jgi:hypothetical protein
MAQDEGTSSEAFSGQPAGKAEAPGQPAARPAWQRWPLRAAVVAAFIVVGLLALRGVREHRLRLMFNELATTGDFPRTALGLVSDLLKTANADTDGVIDQYVAVKPTRAWDRRRRMLFVARRQAVEYLPGGREVYARPPLKGEPSVPGLLAIYPGGPDSFAGAYTVFDEGLDFKGLSCRDGLLSIEFVVDRRTSETLALPPEKVWTATLPVDEVVTLVDPAKQAAPPGQTAAEMTRQRLVALLKKAGASL